MMDKRVFTQKGLGSIFCSLPVNVFIEDEGQWYDWRYPDDDKKFIAFHA